jgi:hypothetical protein
VPADLAKLLGHADELVDRTGITLHSEPGWAPWADTSYLSAADRANPDIMANVRAIAEVCASIAFVAAHEDDEYIGYWRSPGRRRIADSPLVCLDNEGRFCLCGGSTFAEILLARTDDEADFEEFRDWLRSLGIAVAAESANELAYPADDFVCQSNGFGDLWGVCAEDVAGHPAGAVVHLDHEVGELEASHPDLASFIRDHRK